MRSTLSFFFGSIRCALDNRWFVEGETWRIQGKICGRDAFEFLKVCPGIRERKFGEFLTARIIVSSVGRQASTRMQSTESTNIAAKWEMVLEVSRRTLECTTQRGLQTVLHPSLIRRF